MLDNHLRHTISHCGHPQNTLSAILFGNEMCIRDRPWDYPLTSLFDENDAIFVFDNAFVPWENVVIYRDIERLKSFYPRSGFFNGFTYKGAQEMCIRDRLRPQ